MKLKLRRMVIITAIITQSIYVYGTPQNQENYASNSTQQNTNTSSEQLDSNELSTLEPSQISSEQKLVEPTSYYEEGIPEISADAAILIDVPTSTILYEKNMNKMEYPASTTKIMTALLTLEDPNYDLDSEVYFSEEAVFSVPAGSSNIAMNPNEIITTEEALYGLMVASANDVANGLAEHVSGDIESFVELMNQRAEELGATNTHFTNAHGFYDPDHYTTAYDLALIMQEAIKYPQFVKVAGTSSYSIPPTNEQPETRYLNNTNPMISENSVYYYPYVVAGKTGFTDEAQHNLVTYAKKDDIELIAVVLHDGGQEVYTDTAALLDYGFSQYKTVTFLEQDEYSTEISITDSTTENNEIVQYSTATIQNDITYTIPYVIEDEIIIQENYPSSISDLIIEGQIVGTVDLVYNGQVLESTNLVADQTVNIPKSNNETEKEIKKNKKENKTANNIINKVVIYSSIVIFILIIIFFIGLLKIRQKRQKMYQYKSKRKRELIEPDTKIEKDNYKYK